MKAQTLSRRSTAELLDDFQPDEEAVARFSPARLVHLAKRQSLIVSAEAPKVAPIDKSGGIEAAALSKVRSMWKDITPAMATKWLENNVRNRSISKDVVNAYARDMKNKAFVPTHQGIAFNDRDELIDGQHTLHAIIKSGMTVRRLVTFGLPSQIEGTHMMTMDVVDLGCTPSMEFLADASPVGALPSSFSSMQDMERAGWVGYCLTAPNKFRGAHSRYNLGSENFVAEEGRWSEMLERAREVEARGLRLGLAQADLAEAWAAGNAVCPQVAEWIARILNRS